MMEVNERDLVDVFMSLQLENIKLRMELSEEKKIGNMWHHEWRALKGKYEPDFFEGKEDEGK